MWTIWLYRQYAFLETLGWFMMVLLSGFPFCLGDFVPQEPRKGVPVALTQPARAAACQTKYMLSKLRKLTVKHILCKTRQRYPKMCFRKVKKWTDSLWDDHLNTWNAGKHWKVFLSLSYHDKVIQLLFNGIRLECRRLCSQVRHLLVRKGQVSAAKHIQTYPNIRYLGFEGSPRDPGKDRSIFERTVDSRLQSWQDVTDIKNDPWIT